MAVLTETAYAKLNLALHVRRRRADGYHELETLFAFCEAGDVLTAASAERLTLDVTGPFAAAIDGDNLVLRAAERLREAFGLVAGAALGLDKRLPVASGIGGGSADAAAALRLLCRVWGIDPGDPRVGEIATSLGADVPACLLSRACLGTGRGDALAERETPFDGVPVLLVNPLVPLSTARVFAGWDGIDRGPIDAARVDGWRNDLQPPAEAAVPVVAEIVTRLATAPGVRLARMSGSGATCFALFEDADGRDRAAAAIGAERPDWWRLATRLKEDRR